MTHANIREAILEAAKRTGVRLPDWWYDGYPPYPYSAFFDEAEEQLSGFFYDEEDE